MAERAQLNHGAPEASDASASAITSVETRHFRLPLAQPMTDATHGMMTHFEVVMVILEAGGQQGIGYTYTIGLGGKALRALIDDVLTPILLGGDAGRGAQIWEQLWWRSHYIGRGGLASFAIAAVDIALWDWRARRANEALWRYLGGAHGRARAYAGGIDLQLSTEGLLEQTQENLERGFRAIKIKVGRERLREDIARVAAVRELIGPDIPLMVDANMRWTVEQACRAASALREFELTWLEEPTIPDDYRGHARIARRRRADRHWRESAYALRIPPHAGMGRYRFPRAGREQHRRDHELDARGRAGAGAQPAGYLARRARAPPLVIGGNSERQLPGGTQLRAGALHAQSAGARRRLDASERRARPRRRIRLGGAGRSRERSAPPRLPPPRPLLPDQNTTNEKGGTQSIHHPAGRHTLATTMYESSEFGRKK